MMMKTPQEELLEKQMARCAEAADSCLAFAEPASKYSEDIRKAESREAARLMGTSARLADALVRLRAQERMGRQKEHSKNHGSNGPADQET